MKVSLFVTCLVDQLFPQVGLSTVKILKKLGVEVEFDVRQTCCGQPAFNTGYVEEAARVARHFLEVYNDSAQIVVPSGSCCAMIKVFLPQLFPEGSTERRRAKEIAERTLELSDFLISVLGVKSTGARFREPVTYHDSCHLLRELGISSQPRRLIRAVEDIDFREMENPERCCGFGGTFSVKFADVSAAIGEDKVQCVRNTGARYVIANDVSCLMHIEGLLRRNQVPVRTMHLAELLAKFDD
ncbi:(Fe-S)-binding protein [Acidobacteria bacterium AH-259-O06]|nr:(Fe-S)-binding protein [Acidobacteria bacterium AH-259-O06]